MIMKQYKDTDSNTIILGNKSIPKSLGNSDYQKYLKEIEAGEAELLPFVEPIIPVDQRRQTAILSEWPVHKQLEALTEDRMGRSELLAQLKAHITQVKIDFPK